MTAIDDPNISDLVEALISAQLRNLWTCQLGKVVSYNDETQRADIQLIGREQDPDNPEGRRFPLLGKVPVMWPRGKQWSIHGPLEPGDSVVVWFMVQSVDDWIKDGVADRVPQRRGRFRLSNAVCSPGVSPDTDLISGDGTDPNALVLRAPLTIVRESEGAEDFVALAQLVLNRLDEIASSFNSHGHVETGGITSTPTQSVTPPPSPEVMGPFDPVAATKLKAE